MNRKWIALLGVFALALPLAAQDEPTKEEVKLALKEFKASLKTAQSESDIVDALNALGEMQHVKVFAELKKWLLGNTGAIKKAAYKEILLSAETREEVKEGLNSAYRTVRFAAAENLAKYKNDRNAGETLIAAVRAMKNDPDTQEKFIECAGQTGYKKIDKKVCALFNHRNILVARAAISATTDLKTRICITELIKLVKGLEGISEEQTGAGAPQMPGPGNVGGSQENEQIKRKRALLPSAKQALKDITGERYNTGNDWFNWWRKNARKYTEPE
jgi:hypothetical protein